MKFYNVLLDILSFNCLELKILLIACFCSVCIFFLHQKSLHLLQSTSSVLVELEHFDFCTIHILNLTIGQFLIFLLAALLSMLLPELGTIAVDISSVRERLAILCFLFCR